MYFKQKFIEMEKENPKHKCFVCEKHHMSVEKKT